MSSTTTKNLLLSQPKAGQFEGVPVTYLTHSVEHKNDHTEIRVEIPGIDPSTVNVEFDNNTLHVECARGVLTLPVDLTVDTSKIKADIVWGMLTAQATRSSQHQSEYSRCHRYCDSPCKNPICESRCAKGIRRGVMKLGRIVSGITESGDPGAYLKQEVEQGLEPITLRVERLEKKIDMLILLMKSIEENLKKLQPLYDFVVRLPFFKK